MNGEEPFVTCVVGAKRGGGEGGGGGREKNSKVSYPLSPTLLPFSLPPYPLPDSTPATKARPFDERHYLGKTLRRVLFSLVCIKKKKKLFTKSAGSAFDWFGPFYHLSLVMFMFAPRLCMLACSADRFVGGALRDDTNRVKNALSCNIVTK